jgi:glyoxylase-like metal-dependent hydrolase (beta-lactamase superfamily II)
MLLHRRLFLAQGGRVTFGVLVVAATGCSRSTPPAEEAQTSPSPTELAPVDWHRINLGLVSAYILARGREAAIVDTGWQGSAAAIQSGLEAAGLSWASVAHVIITHKHPDHIGSLPGVLARATNATPYAGEADVAAIQTARPVTALADADQVFGLQVIATPGHTPGHIALLDRETGLLVAGDAVRGAPDGGAAAPVAQYTEDMAAASESIRKLAGYRFDVAVFGHGEPIEGDASEAVKTLAEQL